MAKVQIDVDDDLHLDIKVFHAKLEKETKKKQSLRETYVFLVKKGIECIKKETPAK